MKPATAVLTISDSAHSGTRDDVSGPRLRARLAELGWPVAAHAVVPDSEDAIATTLTDWADRNVAQLIVTTGGTGLGPRDVTPEATRAVIKREVPGLAERMRLEGYAKVATAILSRAVCGARGRTLIVNLPGSPRGAVESLDAIVEVLPHAIDLLQGNTEHAESKQTRGS